MPVSASPVPPVAMPGFPVVFTKTSPFGAAITVPAPFSTTVTPCLTLKPRAALMRSFWTPADVVPSRRAISPGWGVRTSGARAFRRTSGAVARAFRPSASITSGTPMPCTSPRTACTVS